MGKSLAQLHSKLADKVAKHKNSRDHHGHPGTIDPTTLKVALDDIKENIAAGDPNATADDIKGALNEAFDHIDDIISLVTD